MRRDGRPAGSAACSEPVRGGPMTTAVAFDKRILKELAAVVGRDYVLHDPVDLKVFEYDGTIARAMPQIVVLPETAEQVSEVVKLARRYGLPVTPRGAGTGLSGGAIAATRAVLRARPGQPARLHGGRQRGGERRRAPLPGLRRYHEPHPRPGARPGPPRRARPLRVSATPRERARCAWQRTGPNATASGPVARGPSAPWDGSRRTTTSWTALCLAPDSLRSCGRWGALGGRTASPA